jgi:hypothetical protein
MCIYIYSHVHICIYVCLFYQLILIVKHSPNLTYAILFFFFLPSFLLSLDWTHIFDVTADIVEDMINKCKAEDIARNDEAEDGFVLVLDPQTARIVSSCCRMYDIMEAGVLGK